MTIASWLDLGSSADTLTLAARLAGKGAILLALGLLASVAMRRRSAAARHLVCALTLTGALVVPALEVVVPQWKVALLPAPAADAAVARAGRAIAPAPIVQSRAARRDLDAPARRTSIETERPTVASLALAATAVVPMPLEREREGAPAIRARPIDVVLAVWLAGALAVLLPIAVSHLRLGRLARRARATRDARWLVAFAHARSEMRFTRHVHLLEADGLPMPMTWGVREPVVLVPAAASPWSDARRLDVLRHELAHVERRDCLVQLVAHLACAVHWFDPLAWVLAYRLRVERELACDDRVLEAGARASDYAACLLDVARGARAPHPGAIAALAMARRSHLTGRLHALLDEHRARRAVSRRATVRASAFAFAIAVPLAAVMPTARAASRVPHAPTTPPSAPATRASAPGAANGARLATARGIIVAAAVATSAVLPVADAAAIAAPTPSSDPILPAAACPRDAAGKSSHSNMSKSDNGRRRWTVRIERGDCALELQAAGDVAFDDDLTDVTRLDPDGSFWIEQRLGHETRRLEIRPQGGALEHVYYENGERRAYDDAARRWFAETLLGLERSTAFAAKQRVPALLRRGGVDALLAEAARMESDYARRAYYAPALATGQLTSAQVERVVDDASRNIDSDYEMAELLVAAAKTSAFDARSHDAFVRALGTIGSDYERRRATVALLDRDAVSPQVLAHVLDAAAEIKSDYELAELLIKISGRYAIDDATRPTYLRALRTIDSDYEHGRVLAAIANGSPPSSAITRALLEDAARIRSPYELTRAVMIVMAKGRIDSSNEPTLFAAIGAIKGDYERHRALSALLARQPVSRGIARGVLQAARSIDSDYECSSLLIEVARAVPIEGDLRADYEAAAKTIGGEYEYGRAMAALRSASSRTP